MFGSILNIAAAAMSANRLRMNTIASNLANAETTRTAEGGPYKRRDVVFSATPLQGADFENELDKASVKSVRVAAVLADDKPPMMVYDPGHPDADKTTGMVAMPNINPVTEMVNMLEASNAYKAAAEVAGSAKEIANTLQTLANTAG